MRGGAFYSRGFLNEMEKEVPNAKGDWAFLRFLQYILEPRKRREDWECVVWRECLAEIEGKPCNGHYKAEAFLSRIKAKYLPDLEWNEYRFRDAKARVLIKDGVPDAMRKLVRREWRGEWDESGLVLEDGKPLSSAGLRAIHREKALISRGLIGPDIVRTLFDLLNEERRPQLYNAIVRPEQMSAAREMICDIYCENEHTRDYQLGVLRGMEHQSVPFYKAVRRSARLYGANPSLLYLKREVRHLLTAGLPEADLTYAQCAICAYDWGVPAILDYLKGKPPLWKDSCRDLGQEYTPKCKGVLKEGTYASFYGSSRANVIAALEAGLGIPGIGEKFLQTPFMSVMCKARDIQLAAILKEGGRRDCFGRWLALPRWSSSRTKKEAHDLRMKEARSILARCAQAYEMKLLAPVIEMAQTHDRNHGFRLMLWQHDGFSIHILREDSREKWKDNISRAVSARAEELGIPTQLEWSEE